MKKDGMIENVMHFLVHNGFVVTVTVMGLVHATLLLIMLVAGVWPLVNLNVLSVVVYLFCVLLCKFGHIMPAYISILLEVSVYTIVSVHIIGWSSAPVCFLCSIVPIIIYFGSFLFKGAARWTVVLILVLNFGLYVALFLGYDGVQPLYEIATPIRRGLIIFSSFVMVFSMIFYNVLYIYSSEAEKSNLERKNEQLSADAREDALTSLLNRRGFLPVVEEYMNNELTRYFCIAFCDIDNFKRINDTYGHDCGDEVLRHITKMIKREMQGCSICRWGGEEIIILMKDYDLAVAKEKMEYLRKHVEANPTVFYNKRVPATITIGLEENKDSYRTPDDIIKVADERMYYGKQHGKNILIYTDVASVA